MPSAFSRRTLRIVVVVFAVLSSALPCAAQAASAQAGPKAAAQPQAAQAPAAPGSLQQVPGQPGYHLSVTTRIVVLDVVVTDKHGKLVHRPDLTKNDFKVYENKVPQTIVSFETPAQHAMPASADGKAIVNSAADLPKIGDAPVTILVLDELNSVFEDMSFSRQMMVKYLMTQPEVLKQPTALLIATNTKFVPVHDYTQDRDALVEVVKKHMPEFPYKMMNGGRGGPAAVERMAQVLASLQQLAQATSGTPGRKNVIWVGNGFPSADLVGLDDLEAQTIQASVRAVTAKLLASRITMYTINPQAGTSAVVDVETPDDMDATGPDVPLDPFGGTVNFTQLATQTGGMAFMGRNDINNVIGEGIAMGDEYYTMSYRPTEPNQDPTKYRDITIVMKDPNLRATTREGYYPDTAADLNPVEDKTIPIKQVQRDLELDLSQALTSVISYNGLDVSATKAGGNSYTVQVKEERLTWSAPGPDGAQHAEATVAAAWYDAKGKMLGHMAREETFPRGASNAGATFTMTLPNFPSNVARTRFVVRDAMSGKMGTVDLGK